MEHKDLLIEIGLEEMPARFIEGACQQLADRLAAWLDENAITYEEIATYSTPRRLAVLASSVAPRQADLVEEKRGPSLAIARNEDGSYSRATEGFVRGQGASTDDLYVETVNGVEYVFLRIERIGEPVEGLLGAALPGLVSGMTFPKNMRWGDRDLRFLRPIHWLVALYGEQVIPFSVAGIESGNVTYGHRFLGKKIKLTSPADYQQVLAQEYVIADREDRKALIVKQLRDLMADRGWQIPIDEVLINEIVNLVEYPTVLVGSFAEEYLELPPSVLVTTMKVHQRYFPVEDSDGALLPYFIAVRNGDSTSLDLVARGNEKVITARLADARFFYLEDLKIPIADQQAKLSQLVFQDKLGTMADKSRRLVSLSSAILKLITDDNSDLGSCKRAAEICKFDLVTNMVNEFPELQGYMGELYALKQGEPAAVAQAINEHYSPRFSGDSLPASLCGQIVSIADKLDNIVGAFSIGSIPTGSQDPLGLRRAATGIVQIIQDKLPALKLDQLFQLALVTYEEAGLLYKDGDVLNSELAEFFQLRIRRMLQDEQVSYDIIDAVLAAELSDISLILERSALLGHLLTQDSSKAAVDSLTRVINIAGKAESSETNPDSYVEVEEHALYQAYQALLALTDSPAEAGAAPDQSSVIAALWDLHGPIDNYFAKVMVMVDDPILKRQRLGLLRAISEEILKFADFRKLVFD